MGIQGAKHGRHLPNEIRCEGDDVFISIGAGLEAVVDSSDYRSVAPFRWGVLKRGTNTYAHSQGLPGDPFRRVLLHRFIFGPCSADVEHRDRNGLNCRRGNLRAATRSQNNANRAKFGGSSRFKGVCWDRIRKRWKARIKVNKKIIYLGCFVYEFDAAQAYNFSAEEHFREFSRLNAPC